MSGAKWRRLAWRPLLPAAGPGPGRLRGRVTERSEGRLRRGGVGAGAAGPAAAGPCLSAAVGERRAGGGGARPGPVPPSRLGAAARLCPPGPHGGSGPSRRAAGEPVQAARGLFVPARAGARPPRPGRGGAAVPGRSRPCRAPAAPPGPGSLPGRSRPCCAPAALPGPGSLPGRADPCL